MELLRLVALAMPVALSLPLVAGFFGGWHPCFDTLAHFRMHLAVATAISALPALLLGFWKEAGLSVALGLGAFLTTVNFLTTPLFGQVNAAAEPEPQTQATYRLLHVNTRFDNATPEKLLSLIGRTRPDIVALNEVSTSWVKHLQRISAAYPYSVFCDPQSRIGPAAILSRRPFAAGTEGACFEGGAMATAEIDLGGRTVTVAALHLKWPWPFGQAGQIDRLAGPLSRLGGSALAAGDLNATPWSNAVARIAHAGGLARVGGSTPTWLSRRLPVFWRQWIGLPIDHVFRKGGVTVHSVNTQEDVGSDHAPLLVEFSLGPVGVPAEERSVTVLNDHRVSF
ncbi:MAG TPA: endonuclease/exonuclease/phosphatase family protein [Rhizobiaceae bacterium]|nr:endonuclease/exonuclease/phosphatase family protein [Rhizobiaceae bacterium]